jgi:hypothetical protein
MLKKILSILKVISIILVSILIMGILFIKLLDLFMNRYSDKVFSPDGTFYAQVSETNGGATTGFISGVLIINAKSLFSYSNRLSSLTGNSKGVFGSNGSGASIKTSWLDNKTLKITYSDCSKIYGQDKSWKDIKIVYDGKCSENN